MTEHHQIGLSLPGEVNRSACRESDGPAQGPLPRGTQVRCRTWFPSPITTPTCRPARATNSSSIACGAATLCLDLPALGDRLRRPAAAPGGRPPRRRDRSEGLGGRPAKLVDGGTLELTQLGAMRTQLLAELRDARANVLRGLGEAEVFPGMALGGAADLCLYDDALVIVPVSGPPLKVPFPFVQGVETDASGYALTLRVVGGDPVLIERLASRTTQFLDLLRTRSGAAAGRTAHFLAALLPELGPIALRAVAARLRDGVAAPARRPRRDRRERVPGSAHRGDAARTARRRPAPRRARAGVARLQAGRLGAAAAGRGQAVAGFGSHPHVQPRRARGHVRGRGVRVRRPVRVVRPDARLRCARRPVRTALAPAPGRRHPPLNDPGAAMREFPGTDVAAVNRQLDLAEFH